MDSRRVNVVSWLREVIKQDEAVVHRFTHGHDSDTSARDWKLADIAAKLAILDEYEADDMSRTPDYWLGLHVAIIRLAAAYADRPGYQEDWRP